MFNIKLMLDLFPPLFQFKFLLAPSHAPLKNFASLNENTSCPPLASELDDRTNFGDLDASPQFEDL